MNRFVWLGVCGALLVGCKFSQPKLQQPAQSSLASISVTNPSSIDVDKLVLEITCGETCTTTDANAKIDAKTIKLGAADNPIGFDEAKTLLADYKYHKNKKIKINLDLYKGDKLAYNTCLGTGEGCRDFEHTVEPDATGIFKPTVSVCDAERNCETVGGQTPGEEPANVDIIPNVLKTVKEEAVILGDSIWSQSGAEGDLAKIKSLLVADGAVESLSSKAESCARAEGACAHDADVGTIASQWDAVKTEHSAGKVRTVLMNGGLHDLLQTAACTEDATAEGCTTAIATVKTAMTTLATDLQNHKVKHVMMLGYYIPGEFKPVAEGDAQTLGTGPLADLNKALEEVCTELNNEDGISCNFIATAAAFSGAEGMIQADALNPTVVGAEKIVELILGQITAEAIEVN